ncbi:MAG: hypothetical protein KZQ92_09485 [Candidatus Thiodiazotropha sp. (ex Lucinoma borealis)]|nr:hypothetical protein [Candidatus Thiodiazotropha sp. (ex Lucinoma borealis)]
MQYSISRKLVGSAVLVCFVVLSGCVATKSQKPSMVGNDVANKQPPESGIVKQVEEVRLTNSEVLSLFKELQKRYQNNTADPNYINDLNKFEGMYGHNWDAKGLISIERGRAYYQQAFDNIESPYAASSIFNKSRSEFQSGLHEISTSDIEDKDIVYSEFARIIDNATYCQAKYRYLSNKIKSLDANNVQIGKRSFLNKYIEIYNDESCPIYVKAWSVNDSISHNTDKMAFSKRLNDAYQYVSKSNNAEEKIYITSALAWAEFSLGNYRESIKLYDQLDNKRIKENEKNIYNSDGMISTIEHYSALVAAALEREVCVEYWHSNKSSERDEKELLNIVESYNELHDMANKGRSETTPVYKTLTYSSEKIVVDYNVSPLLFKVQSASERLLGKIKSINADKYPVFVNNMLGSVSFLQKSVDYRIKGYYIKKKDYRGEWEKADAYIDESRGLYSEALKSAIEMIKGTSNSNCLVDDWNRYVKAVSEMSM